GKSAPPTRPPLPRSEGERSRDRPGPLLVDVYHGGRREAVEMRAARGRVGADVLAVDVVAGVQVQQLFGEADGVERVAGRAEHRAKLQRPFLEALEVILAVVEDHAAEGVVDAVVQVVAELAAAHGLADDLGDRGGGGGDEEPPRLGEDLKGRREKAV